MSGGAHRVTAAQMLRMTVEYLALNKTIYVTLSKVQGTLQKRMKYCRNQKIGKRTVKCSLQDTAQLLQIEFHSRYGCLLWPALDRSVKSQLWIGEGLMECYLTF